jgi:hypothetical protein
MSQSGQKARPSGDRWRTARAAQRLLASGNDTIGRVRADGCAHEGPKCRQRRRVRRRHSARAGHVAAQNATGWNVRMAGLLPRAIGDSRRVPGMADDRRRRSCGRGSHPRQEASHHGLKHEHICNDVRNPGTRSVPLLTVWTDHALADFRSRGRRLAVLRMRAAASNRPAELWPNWGRTSAFCSFLNRSASH